MNNFDKRYRIKVVYDAPFVEITQPKGDSEDTVDEITIKGLDALDNLIEELKLMREYVGVR